MLAPRTPSIAALVIACASLAFAPGTAAQNEPAGTTAETAAADPQADLAATRAALAEEIRELEQRIEQQPGGSDLVPELESLQELERTLARQAQATERATMLAERLEEAERRLAAGPRQQLSQDPPYLLALLDALADALDAQRQRAVTVKEAERAAKEALEAAEKAWEQAEKQRRRAAEAAERSEDPAEAARLKLALRKDQLTSRTAESRRDLARVEVAALDSEVEIQEDEVRLLEDTVAWVRSRLSLAPDSDPSSTAQMEELEFAAQRQIEQGADKVPSHERRLADAERRWNATPGNATLRAEVEAQRAELYRWQLAATTGEQALSDWQELAVLQERRVKVLAEEIARPQLRGWQAEAEARRDELRRNLRLLEARRGEFAEEREQIQGLATAATVVAEKRWLQRHADALSATLALMDTDRSRFQKIASSADRVLSEMKERSEQVTLAERSQDLVDGSAEAWQYELFVVEDQAITVGKIATALLLFVLGYLLARLTSRALGGVVLRRLGLAAGAATAIQGLVFYALLLIFFLFALRSVNIPLTVFTVLGGALAIGVGFGSQNIVNNFISGLILLAERPIKVGDVIEVDGTKGMVETIGPRSTRVRTFDNIHMIIPNSAFLEKNVVNWTLTDDDIRTHIDVGVAYGSTTRDVKGLLERAVGDHGRIMKRPEPLILFRDFGDDALRFRVYFWVRSRDMAERLTIESDVRYRIDHLFREAGITIAFPQRDVHLDTSSALELRLVAPEAPTGEDPSQRFDSPSADGKRSP